MSINEDVRAELAAHAALTAARLSVAQAENEDVRAELAELRAELAAHAVQLADVYASTSWRLSAPVRVAGREAGRLAASLMPAVMQWRGPCRGAPPAVTPAGAPPPGAPPAAPPPAAPPGAAEAGQPPKHLFSDPLLLAAEAGRLEYRPTFSILVPVCDTAPDSLRRAVDAVLAQAYPEWELILCDDGSTNAETRVALEEVAELDPRIRLHVLGVNRGSAAATNAALALAQGELVAMLGHEDELLPAALLEVVKALIADPSLDVVCADRDKVEAGGAVAQTLYKPFWSLEMLRGVLRVGHLLVVRRSLAEGVGGLDPACDGAQGAELMLRLAENAERSAPEAATLYRWRTIPAGAALAGASPEHAPRLRVAPQPRSGYPLISVVVRAAGVEAHLEACCARILAAESYPRREIIVTGGDIAGGLARHLEAMGVVLEAPGQSGSAAGLAGLARAGGDLIVSMVGDLEVHTPDWLEQLLLASELPGVACVAPLILASDGTVASAGLIVGGEGLVGLTGAPSCVREVIAVSGDCHAVARPVLALLGGLSPYYATAHYQAVDLALRASSKGLRDLCTPRVVMRHRVPTLRDGHRDARDRQRDALDQLLLADAWDALVAPGHLAPGHRA